MTTEIKIADSFLCIPIEPIIDTMSFEQKREMLAWLATDSEVIESVVSYITGTDDQGWSTGDPNRRQRILSEIEGSQLGETRYNWKPWDEIRQKVKDIRSSEHLYWTLHHKIDQELSRKIFAELRRIGVESNYTTKEGDADVLEIKNLINSTFAGMRKETETTQPA